MDRRALTARTRAARAALAAFVAFVAVASGVAVTTVARADDSSPLVSVPPPPPAEVSPFSSAKQFCTSPIVSTPKNRRDSAPGVTANRIAVALVTPIAGTAAAGTTTVAVGDPVTEARTFAQLINKCGGILGRKLDLQIVPQTSDPQADCVAATDTLHPFAVVAWAPFAGAPCVAGDHRTVIVATGTTEPNDALIPMQGRLAAGHSNEGVIDTQILDLVDSGALDKKRVTVVATTPAGAADAQAVRQLLFRSDPNRKIVVTGGSTAPPDPRADVVIATSFDPDLAALAHKEGGHPVAVYSLGDASDSTLDASRVADGTEAAKQLADAPVFGWMTADNVQWRADRDPTRFATLCNDAYTSARATATTTTTPGATTTTTPSDVAPDSAYQQIAQICLAIRTTVRALYQAGANPTVRSLTRALYRLPYIDEIANAPKARPNQVINEPVRRARHPVFLAKPQYPCTEPSTPKEPAAAAMCWVPVDGYEDGHAVDAPL